MLNFIGRMRKDLEFPYHYRIQQSLYPGNSDNVISMQLNCFILDTMYSIRTSSVFFVILSYFLIDYFYFKPLHS